MAEDLLKEYRHKRNFERTPEPAGKHRQPREAPVFVIQKHAATTLHYDFRLQIGGVLKSWSIPRGPSTDTREKRLAIPTEDHPLEYAGFEGVIPRGEYGGGTVLVWDTGTYLNLMERNLIEGDDEVPLEDQYERGHITVWLHGQKIKGGYALTRVGGNNRWILVKMDDSEADRQRDPVKEQPNSVLSGRSLDEIAAQSRSREKAGPRSSRK